MAEATRVDSAGSDKGLGSSVGEDRKDVKVSDSPLKKNRWADEPEDHDAYCIDTVVAPQPSTLPSGKSKDDSSSSGFGGSSRNWGKRQPNRSNSGRNFDGPRSVRNNSGSHASVCVVGLKGRLPKQELNDLFAPYRVVRVGGYDQEITLTFESEGEALSMMKKFDGKTPKDHDQPLKITMQSGIRKIQVLRRGVDHRPHQSEDFASSPNRFSRSQTTKFDRRPSPDFADIKRDPRSPGLNRAETSDVSHMGGRCKVSSASARIFLESRETTYRDPKIFGNTRIRDNPSDPETTGTSSVAVLSNSDSLTADDGSNKHSNNVNLETGGSILGPVPEETTSGVAVEAQKSEVAPSRARNRVQHRDRRTAYPRYDPPALRGANQKGGGHDLRKGMDSFRENDSPPSGRPSNSQSSSVRRVLVQNGRSSQQSSASKGYEKTASFGGGSIMNQPVAVSGEGAENSDSRNESRPKGSGDPSAPRRVSTNNRFSTLECASSESVSDE